MTGSQTPYGLDLSYPSLKDGQYVWTATDCARSVAAIKKFLEKAGVVKGLPVGLVLNNSCLTVGIYLALLEIGAIAVSINTRWSEQEIQTQLDRLNCQIVISDRSLSVAGCTLITPAELTLEIPRKIPLRTSREIATTPSITTQIHLESATQTQGIFFTSGTTGSPKGVQLTIGNHYHSALAVNRFLEQYLHDNAPRWLLALPLYHVGGMAILWRVLLRGGHIAIVPKFDVETVISCVRSGEINLISLVPTMLNRIINHPLFLDSLPHWQSLAGIFLGGARSDRSLLQKCLDYQLPVLVTYGMTECASQISILDIHKFPLKLDSVGQVLDHIQLEISDPDPVSGIGEIAISSPSLTYGYYGDDSLPVTQKGYYLSGDLGYWDTGSENFLYLVDRRTDLIISGGENIYPAELEQILIKHPQIEEVVVIAVADPEWGQVPGVVYTGADNLTLSELQNYCLRENLARYKLPKYLRWLTEMPLTNSSKIDRQLLRQMFKRD